jgi:hypothetical protein
VLWALCEELNRPHGLSLAQLARISTLKEQQIHKALNCPDSLSALRTMHRWPPDLLRKAPIQMFLQDCLSKRRLRVARHYRGAWNRDVILCLSLPDRVVSDSLLHLASQCGEDESVYSLAREITSDFGYWPFSQLPRTYDRLVDSVNRHYNRRLKDEVFPQPILPPPGWAMAIETPKELRRVAIDFRNCLFSYLDSIRLGKTTAYYSDAPEPEIAWVIEEEKDGTTLLGPIAGKNNVRPEPHDVEAVEQWFERRGQA